MKEKPFRADEELLERLGRLHVSKEGRVRAGGRDTDATVASDDGLDP